MGKNMDALPVLWGIEIGEDTNLYDLRGWKGSQKLTIYKIIIEQDRNFAELKYSIEYLHGHMASPSVPW
jgi:hypothetical protein